MKIKKESEEAFAMNLSRAEVEIFVRSMKETVQRIPTREYQTRMGAEIADIERTITSLQTTLKQ